jgi:sulfite reductase (NADPH) hemoprotein beta-component
VGGDNVGERLNTLFRENLDETQILSELDSLFVSFKANRNGKETFGDYTWRTQLTAAVSR